MTGLPFESVIVMTLFLIEVIGPVPELVLELEKQEKSNYLYAGPNLFVHAREKGSTT